MRLAIIAPYAEQSVENNFLELIACYLRGTFPDTYQLICDGAIGFCRRDLNSRNERDCNVCQREQVRYQKWGNTQAINLSSLISGQDFKEAATFTRDYKIKNLRFFEGLDVAEILETNLPLFQPAVPIVPSQLQNHLINSIALLSRAATHLIQNIYPDQVLLSAANDFFSQSFMAILKNRKLKYSSFTYDSQLKKIIVWRSFDQQILTIDFLLSSLQNVRADYKTWPPEALALIHDVLQFIGLKDSQLTLPLVK